MKFLEIQVVANRRIFRFDHPQSFIEACKSDKDGQPLLQAADPNHDSS